MMTRLLRSEWIRGKGRPVEKYTGAVVLIAGALIPIIMILMSSRNALMRKSALETLAFPASIGAARTMATILGPLWAAALGPHILGPEYQYRTCPPRLLLSSTRVRLALRK